MQNKLDLEHNMNKRRCQVPTVSAGDRFERGWVCDGFPVRGNMYHVPVFNLIEGGTQPMEVGFRHLSVHDAAQEVTNRLHLRLTLQHHSEWGPYYFAPGKRESDGFVLNAIYVRNTRYVDADAGTSYLPFEHWAPFTSVLSIPDEMGAALVKQQLTRGWSGAEIIHLAERQTNSRDRNCKDT